VTLMKAEQSPAVNRRELLEAAAVAALTAVSGWAVLERYNLRLEAREVPVTDLPPGLDGLRIALLTDLHIGRWATPDLAMRAVAMANRAKPDLAILGGDLAHDDCSDRDLAAMARYLAKLDAPLGTYAVLGNHDYLASAPRVEAALADAGLPVLINRGRAVQARGSTLWVAGLDDAWFGTPDLKQALAGAPGDAFRLLAVHEPDYADEAIRRPGGETLGLQVSGHSHGGQIRLPGIGPLILPRMATHYPMGLRRVEASNLQVYTSRGIGVTGPPVRFCCPPEVTILKLRAACPGAEPGPSA
jgi:predicted MPP superfamily phosphohydrolase